MFPILFPGLIIIWAILFALIIFGRPVNSMAFRACSEILGTPLRLPWAWSRLSKHNPVWPLEPISTKKGRCRRSLCLSELNTHWNTLCWFFPPWFFMVLILRCERVLSICFCRLAVINKRSWIVTVISPSYCKFSRKVFKLFSDLFFKDITAEVQSCS